MTHPPVLSPLVRSDIKVSHVVRCEAFCDRGASEENITVAGHQMTAVIHAGDVRVRARAPVPAPGRSLGIVNPGLVDRHVAAVGPVVEI